MGALRALLEGVGADGLAEIVRTMCEDFRGMRDGFPDLMHVRDGKVSFVEVKAEGDAIRRNQLTRLRQLENAGIPAEIGRVDYRFDPEQDYVVVDIETTGAWSSGDRITEIGAVKVRNHQVVDEWHSLVNPQRPIPAKIVELTGITNQMVRDAPVFHEVADSFMTFMGDGIIVAHNVNFDYGFLSFEYERLERRFRFPKLCTCVGMRRRYPGHKSYGLGKLCAIYDIELEEPRMNCEFLGAVLSWSLKISAVVKFDSLTLAAVSSSRACIPSLCTRHISPNTALARSATLFNRTFRLPPSGTSKKRSPTRCHKEAP